MNKKILWKIEELWSKYYSLSLRDRDGFSVYKKKLFVTKQSRYCNSNFKERASLLYKNNISIYNPDFHMVSKFNFESSKKPVHNDDYGEYFGLKYSQVLEKNGKLIYLFDNHNKIIQPFLEYAELFGKCFDVIHIDAHDDDAVFTGQKPQNLELEKVHEYITQTRISDFFDFISDVSISICHPCEDSNLVTCHCEPANQSQEICHPELISESRVSNKKLIQDIHRYTKSTDFQKFKKPKNPYILSLDIDIFGPEGYFTDLESKIKIIAEAWQHADVVCVAMSPGFIDQKYGREIIKILI